MPWAAASWPTLASEAVGLGEGVVEFGGTPVEAGRQHMDGAEQHQLGVGVAHDPDRRPGLRLGRRAAAQQQPGQSAKETSGHRRAHFWQVGQ
jgi:hypothetical protein